MCIFPQDEHLEVHRVPNESSPQPTIIVEAPATVIAKATVISVSVFFSIPFTFQFLGIEPEIIIDQFFFGQNSADTNSNADLNEPTSSNNDRSSVPEGVDDPRPPNQILPSQIQSRISISQCHKFIVEGANFRSAPSLDSSVIKGIILAGQSVLLTGTTAYGDGLFWYEATNEFVLTPSIELNAQNQIDANQLGWIAACFVG